MQTLLITVLFAMFGAAIKEVVGKLARIYLADKKYEHLLRNLLGF